MFGRKKKNAMSEYENSLKKCVEAYENLNKVLGQKTIELDKMVEQERKIQEMLYENAERNHQRVIGLIKTEHVI